VKFVIVRNTGDLYEALTKRAGRHLIFSSLGKVAMCESSMRAGPVFRQETVDFYTAEGEPVEVERVEIPKSHASSEQLRYAIASVNDGQALYAVMRFEYCDLNYDSDSEGIICLRFRRDGESGDIRVEWVEPEDVPFLSPDEWDDGYWDDDEYWDDETADDFVDHDLAKA